MKNFLVKAFAVLLLLCFVALGVYLVFIGNGVWTDEGGGELGGFSVFIVKLMLFVFLIAFPLFLMLHIVLPKVFNKLLFKGLNKGIRGGSKMMKYSERCKEQNVPDITVNGVNLPAVMAAVDMVRDRMAGEEIPEFSEDEALPYICEKCGFVLNGMSNFCTNCGKEVKK